MFYIFFNVFNAITADDDRDIIRTYIVYPDSPVFGAEGSFGFKGVILVVETDFETVVVQVVSTVVSGVVENVVTVVSGEETTNLPGSLALESVLP